LTATSEFNRSSSIFGSDWIRTEALNSCFDEIFYRRQIGASLNCHAHLRSTRILVPVRLSREKLQTSIPPESPFSGGI
jgi:hypothetical protein